MFKKTGVVLIVFLMIFAISSIAFSQDTIKVGLLEDRSGTFALHGTPKYHGTMLAIEEINSGYTLKGGPVGPGGKGVWGNFTLEPTTQTVNNEKGDVNILDKGGDLNNSDVIFKQEDEILISSGEEGLLGKQIELIAPDPQSSNSRFQQLVRQLILEEEVDVIMGGFASAEREAIRPMMKQYEQLYFYSNQYEGGVADKYTFCTGAVPTQQIVPVMEYMVENYGPEIYILAADYNFGRLSAAWTKAFAPVLGAEIVGEEYVPLEVSEFNTQISRIQQADPDWIMMYITGGPHSNFYPQANSAGLDYPYGSSINMAQGYEHLRFDAPALSDMHVAVNYMQEIPTIRNQNFVKRWHEKFPDEPYISQQAQNAYVTTHLWARAVRKAGTTETEAVIEALESGMSIEAPEGTVVMDPASHHLTHYIRLARADQNHDISFLKEWPSIGPWWLSRLGVNLVRHPEYKQYVPEEDKYFKRILDIE